MKKIYVLISAHPSPLLVNMVNSLLGKRAAVFINNEKDLPDLKNSYVVFACELNMAGICDTITSMISSLRQKDGNTLEGSRGAVLVHSSTQLYTKSFAQWVILNSNLEGCCFAAHPIAEATGKLDNYLTWQKTIYMSLEDICIVRCLSLGERLFKPFKIECSDNKPRILALHASERKTSNTLLLWNLVKNNLKSCSIQELHVENGSIIDCKGCSFTTCIHFSNQHRCFYGGAMVEDIYPAIESANAIIWICPNYNDALSANLTAVINRLTALYRKVSFYNKAIYAVIVSGNSGGDTVARQLMGSLVINKGFCLPPSFALYATANDPFSVLKVSGIEDKAYDFACSIESFMLNKKEI